MTIGMRLPPNRINGKWVAASKPQALGMVVNDKVWLNTYLIKKTTAFVVIPEYGYLKTEIKLLLPPAINRMSGPVFIS